MHLEAIRATQSKHDISPPRYILIKQRLRGITVPQPFLQYPDNTRHPFHSVQKDADTGILTHYLPLFSINFHII